MWARIEVIMTGANGESMEVTSEVYLDDTKVDVERAANVALNWGLDSLAGWQTSDPVIKRERNRVMEILKENAEKNGKEF